MAPELDIRYYPLLKGREGEFRALEGLTVERREPLTPLIDVPPPSIKFERVNGVQWIQISTVDEALEGYAAKVVKAWGQVDPCLVDLAGFDPADRLASGEHPLRGFFSEAWDVGLAAVPVTGLDRDAAQVQAVREAISGRPLGAAVRLRGPTLAQTGGLANALRALLDQLGKEPPEVDLLLDFGELIKTRVAETSAAIPRVIEALPAIDQWRSLVLCTGAYPAELGGFVGKNKTKELPRRDWRLWHQLIASPGGLVRLPSFGDYGIARADWLSPFDPTEMSVSAKIVYTSSEDWVITKGEKLTTNPLQYHDLAQRLRNHNLFLPETHCPSEAQIIRCADGVGGPGNLRVWMTIGTRHHLEVVTRQLASLV